MKQKRARDLVTELTGLADGERGAFLQGFFRTGPGGYGAGDRFLGITVPVQRKLALRYRHLTLRELGQLLASDLHEVRFCALVILVWQYEHAEDEPTRERIFDFYLDRTRRVNNWDLVDASAPYIVGAHLRTRSQKILDKLARSPLLWERRIAIVATLRLIKHGQLTATFRIAHALLADEHDLIQKAVGWALREAGNVSEAQLVDFLAAHYPQLPRTALRYAIERFPAERRKSMLTGDFGIS